MAPQIQRARAALRAIHRMDALMRASQSSRGDVEAQGSSDAMDSAQRDLDTPLLGQAPTPEEAVAADARTTRPSGAVLTFTYLFLTICYLRTVAFVVKQDVAMTNTQLLFLPLQQVKLGDRASGELYKTSQRQGST